MSNRVLCRLGWSSAPNNGDGAACGPECTATEEIKALLSTWPVKRPANWATRVNTPLNAKELDRVRVSLERGRPYGGDEWVARMVKELGLEHTVRPEGRPRKVSQSATDTTS